MSSATRVALVTGGSRGIGRGIVRQLASSGYLLAINYRAALDEANAAKDEALGAGAPEAEIFQGDVGDTEQGRSLVDRVIARFGRLDVLVNNAGVAPLERKSVLELSEESWDRVLSINLRGPFFLSQYAAGRMMEVPSGDHHAPRSIIFVTSVSAESASVNRMEYCVSKAGLSMAARGLALALADHGIAVFEVRPGVIETDMTGPVRDIYDRKIRDGQISPIRRWGTPLDVGRAVAMLASGQLPFSTGEIVHVDGGLHLPRL